MCYSGNFFASNKTKALVNNITYWLFEWMVNNNEYQWSIIHTLHVVTLLLAIQKLHVVHPYEKKIT